MLSEAYLSGLIFLITQHVVGLLAPGPCTALVIRNSIYSRLQGIWTVFGATLGSFSVKTFSVLGLALLLMHTPTLFQALKVCGGFFLVYLGARSLWDAYQDFYKTDLVVQREGTAHKRAPFLAGYFMSLANPMSSVRFVALFSTVVTLETPLFHQFSYLFVLAIISFAFYLCMALFFSTSTIQEKMTQYRYILNLVLGVSLIYWGVKVLQLSMT
jgi:Putative threonine efflux protein